MNHHLIEFLRQRNKLHLERDEIRILNFTPTDMRDLRTLPKTETICYLMIILNGPEKS